ncbi:MAG TPA: 3-dehydroquinate synthase [Spirochaetota bacterium]|nr:3-dehydroquinate synthase [Spirochaetota bacterium]
MREIKITLENRISTVYTGESLSAIRRFTGPENSVIITDGNILRHYSAMFDDYPVIEIGTGEEIKNLSTIEYIMRRMIELRCTRNTFLLGIGGGIVSDIAGFAASIFMRGIKFGFVSTSLLSQVDASVGGKNGVNVDMTKNMAGVFSQPEFVICDHRMLETLPREEYINGIAELVKTACLENNGLYEFIQANKEKILSMDTDSVSEAVYRCVKYKAAVVEADEKENDLRRVLNLGHTVGHAIEKVKGIKHGFAIAAGIGAALDISVSTGDADKVAADEIKALLSFFGLPCCINDILNKDDIPAIMDAVESDKKREYHSVNFVLLRGHGEPFIKTVDFADLSDILYGVLSGDGGGI